MIRIARVACSSEPYLRSESSSARSTSGRKPSVSKTEPTSWRIAAIRSSPMPVSMLRWGSSVRLPSSCSSSAMKTWFQYSRKRSVSSPGSSSGPPNSTPRSRYISEQGPQGPDGPACQKFSERGSCTIRSSGTPGARHSSIDSESGPSPSSSSPAKTVTQTAGSKPNPSIESSHPNAIASSLK